MRKLVVIAGLLVLSPLALMAQETPQVTPKAELYTGFSYLRLQKTNQLGWDTSLSGNFNKNLALVTDVSGYYNSGNNTVNGIQTKTNGSIQSILVGPRVSDPRGKFNPFAQALFGWSRVRADSVASTAAGTPILSVKNSQNAFGAALGGGLDYHMNPMAAVRIIQVDYMYFKTNNNTKQQGVRLGGGVVFQLGKKK